MKESRSKSFGIFLYVCTKLNDMNWRKLNRRIHQDLGYFFVGLTIIYAISGIALNHLHHWNPDLSTERFSGSYSKNIDFTNNTMEAANQLISEIELNHAPKSVVNRGQNTYRIFLDLGKGNTGSIDINTSEKTFSGLIQKQRPLFKTLNFMHRNNAKQLWTWVSDIYAVGLIILAISGLIIMRGKFGFKRYGVWIVIAGIAIPLIILYLYM